ncbi:MULTISPECIES: nucleotidyltransferase family protein [Micromonospora]|uniref:Nicotine blue oxidoreductase n=1 Tax=Micromonospora yangpuensis TaxID=683228 RepID=A0A1C6UPZ4_9ACTN|nr:nucleotidyltransferase family protein [Micromonospora yangpuensis]GGM08449.1 4-diphosphocytidyl-2C-methyl-D-erythritol synthase [Micromonospora yangpuensis]SCL55889.1 nicotine blue oxidoreductase [Micromonospora yangpuensis]
MNLRDLAGGQAAGLVLAAGAGRRYGGPKAPVFLGQALRVLREGGCDPVLAVLGAGARQARATVDLAGVQVLDNPGWAEGMASSLRLGLTTAARLPGVSAVCVHLVDMPGVSATAVMRLLARADPGCLVRACYDGEAGHPVVLGRDHWAEIVSTVRGDRGARAYLRRHAAQVDLVECGDVAAGYDIDER